MASWEAWFAYLDGRLNASIGAGRIPEIHEFIEETRQRRCDLGLTSRGPGAGVLDERWSTVLFIGYLVEDAAESHHRAASLLYSQGKEAAWFPAALPNCEESRIVKRVSARRRS